MKAFAWVGALFALAGLALVLFPRPFGVAFCRAGKAAGGRNPLTRAVAEGLYDESKAPRLMRAVGWVILLQGLILLAVGLYRKSV